MAGVIVGLGTWRSSAMLSSDSAYMALSAGSGVKDSSASITSSRTCEGVHDV